jgi:hypothetical protein
MPREKQGDAFYPALTHGVIHVAPLRGFLVENGEWRVENGGKRKLMVND